MSCHVMSCDVMSCHVMSCHVMSSYHTPQVMVDLFDEQPEIKNHDDFWQFMEGQLLDGLYWEYWYNDGDDK